MTQHTHAKMTKLTPWGSWMTSRTLRSKYTKMYTDPVKPFISGPAEHALLERIALHGRAAYEACEEAGITAMSFWDDDRAACYLLLGEVCQLVDVPTRDLFLSRAKLRPELREETMSALWGAITTGQVVTPLTALISEVRHVERRRDVQMQLLRGIHTGDKLDRDRMISELERAADMLRSEVPPEDRCEGATAAHEALALFAQEIDAHVNGEEVFEFGWGIPELDRLLGGGMTAGNIYHVAAPEKTGKSQFVLALLARTAWQGDKSVGMDLFSVELSYREIVAHLFAWLGREMAAQHGINGDPQQQHRLAHVPTTTQLLRASPRGMEEEASLRGLLEIGRGMADCLTGLRYSQAAGQTVEWVVAEAERRITQWRAQHGPTAPYLVIVDYGQGLDTTTRTSTEAAAQERIAKALRDLAKRLKVVVLVVLHTGGAVDAKPTAHIHGSKQWAKDTSGMIVLWRPCQASDEPWQWMRAEVVRSRRGQRGHVDLYADMSRAWVTTWQGGTPARVTEVIRALEKASK